MDRTAVLFIGDADWAEFREVRSWLEAHAELRTAAEIQGAIESLHGGFDPALIALADRWPGEFPERQVDGLRRMAPLARISEVLGSWCEGQTCSGEPLAGTLRHYWHQWIARMAPEFARAAAGECPVWGLAPTATDEDRLLALPGVLLPLPLGEGTSHASRRRDRPNSAHISNRGLLAIHTRNAETASALCDAAARRGFGAVWVRSRPMPFISGVRAAIWEATRGTLDEARELAAWRSALGGVPLVALLDFPRLEDRDLARAAGATLIVSKPFWLDDLFGQIERM
ncbi:MAG TPA: hypothetical protein VGY55_25175 [Pirellulales bacterium]|jgi:hypothetical protein|nr:hypothetical protein [Pirellulales bacterium]